MMMHIVYSCVHVYKRKYKLKTVAVNTMHQKISPCNVFCFLWHKFCYVCGVKKQANKVWLSLATLMLFLCIGAFAGETINQRLKFDADITSVEVELTNVESDEALHIQDLFLASFTQLCNNTQSIATPVTFSSSTGFHSTESTGKSLCILFRKLKFNC